MSLFLGIRGTKLYKLEDAKIVSKFIKRGTNKENVWEHGNIRQFWKGAREQGPSLGDPHIFYRLLITKFALLLSVTRTRFSFA